MKNSLRLMPLIIAILTISPQAYAENPKPNQPSCEQQLRTIALAKFKIAGINNAQLQVELGDSDNNNNSQSIRIFMKDNTGGNGGGTLGWLKLDKSNYKLYDITADDSNPKLLKVNPKQIKSFTNQCLN